MAIVYLANVTVKLRHKGELRVLILILIIITLRKNKKQKQTKKKTSWAAPRGAKVIISLLQGISTRE